MASRLQIISDGSGCGTQVLIDGKPVNNVLGVTWKCEGAGLAEATVTFDMVPVELESDLPETG